MKRPETQNARRGAARAKLTLVLLLLSLLTLARSAKSDQSAFGNGGGGGNPAFPGIINGSAMSGRASQQGGLLVAEAGISQDTRTHADRQASPMTGPRLYAAYWSLLLLVFLLLLLVGVLVANRRYLVQLNRVEQDHRRSNRADRRGRSEAFRGRQLESDGADD